MIERDKHRFFLSCLFFPRACVSWWPRAYPPIKANFNLSDAGIRYCSVGHAHQFIDWFAIFLSYWFRATIAACPLFIHTHFCPLLCSWSALRQPLLRWCWLYHYFHSVCASPTYLLIHSRLPFSGCLIKKITGSCTDCGSTGGIAGVGISTAFVAMDIAMPHHMAVIAVLIVIAAWFAYPSFD